MDIVITDIENAIDNITDIGHVVNVIKRERKFQKSKRAFVREYSAKVKAKRKN